MELCTCTSNFTCRVCLDRAVERNIADRNTLGPQGEQMYYIRAEDLGVYFIGPFPSSEAAQEHMDRYFPDDRVSGSGYDDRIVDTVEPGAMICSPEDDILEWGYERDTYRELAEDPNGAPYYGHP